MRYRYNPYCSCGRCRAHGFMGPAVLITLGVLFLLSQATRIYWLDFGHTWPALLIVIGLILFLQHSASAAGHVPREYLPTQQVPPPPPAQPGFPPQGAVVPPPPAQPSGALPPSNYGRPEGRPEDPGVHHG